MTVYIYSKQTLREPRGNLEDDLDDLLGEDGEVTGGGAGECGWNIDLEIDDNAFDEILLRMLTFLGNWGVPHDTYLKIYADDWEEGDDIREVKVLDSE